MNELIATRDGLTIAFTPTAIELKKQALIIASQIDQVTNAAEQVDAVNAQRELFNIRSTCDKAHKEIKRPVIDAGREIDRKAKEFLAAITEEEQRIAMLLGNYAAAERARIAAEVNQYNEQASELERQREADIAKATTAEEIDAIRERYSDLARNLGQAPEIQKADGQILKSDWEITITDIWALVRAHPACVKIEPRRSEIKELLNRGVKVQGVEAKRIEKSQVRSTSKPELIEA